MRGLHFPGLRLVLASASLAGCAGDALPASEATPFGWESALDHYPGALLAGATSGDSLYIVGGGAGNDETSVVLRFDGNRLEQGKVSSRAVLWWAWAFPLSDVWMVGDNATVLRFSADGARYDRIQIGPDDADYYGVWGSAPDDLWIVGGTANQEALLFHGDGEVFEEVFPEGDARSPGAFSGIWGSSFYDVYVVGGDLQEDTGAWLHFDGARWQREPGVAPFLFTAWGSGPNDVWAVGGMTSGIVLHYDGIGIHDVTPSGAPGLRGVVGHEGNLYVVGEEGYSARLIRGGESWDLANASTEESHVLHAAFVAHDRVFAVGGTVSAKERPWEGSLLYMGEPIDSEVGTFSVTSLSGGGD